MEQTSGPTQVIGYRPLVQPKVTPTNPDEDWTIVSNLAERRRVQNRIAQRAYRRKLRDRLIALEKKAEQSQQAHDSDEQWCSDYTADTPPRIEEHHPLFLYKSQFSELVWAEYQKCPSSSGKGNAGRAHSMAQSGADSGSAKSSRRRKRDQFSESEDGDQDKENNRKARLGSPERQSSQRRLCLACPFAKKDPARHRHCYKYMLTRVRDVKQHLARRHRLPLYCSRCMQIFEDELERDEHIRARDCPERPFIAMEGVSERQKAQLGRRVSSKMTEEQQWYTIFDILFPGTPRPISPYVDTELTEELAGFQDFLVDRGPALLTQFLRQRGENTSDLPQEERDLASFQETVLADGLRFICERWADDSRTSDDTAQSDVPSGAEQLTETGLVISSLEESLAITRSTRSYIQNAELFGSDRLGQAGHSDTVFPYIAPHGANLDQNGTDMPWSYEAVFNTDFHFDLDFSQPEIFETRKI